MGGLEIPNFGPKRLAEPFFGEKADLASLKSSQESALQGSGEEK